MLRHTLCSFLALTFVGVALAADEIDVSALAVKSEPAFTKLEVKRPIVLTHANDGTKRVFVASQLGPIYVTPGDQSSAGKVFLDLTSKVVYKDKENEEGLLGLAFHPKYKANGEFFVFYTTSEGAPHTSVISRFRVSKNDPNVADPKSEEVVLKLPAKPYWNHNGGTIAFGPDGMLYIAFGDGGSANDPHNNGQNLNTVLGKILRVDIDKKDAGLGYSIPKDNPFVGQSDTRGEIWALGLRNVWRMSFDRETGVLWAGDVGQDLWEEIDLIVRGGNYGWKLREGLHQFVPKNGKGDPAALNRSDLIEPIFEYHHDLGKSITGGHVYRGNKAPALAGLYLYADYVTGKLYALKYDTAKKKVTANHSIPGNIKPVLSYGEDEQGEVYFLTADGVYGFAASK